jgi:hypothetical protein
LTEIAYAYRGTATISDKEIAYSGVAPSRYYAGASSWSVKSNRCCFWLEPGRQEGKQDTGNSGRPPYCWSATATLLIGTRLGPLTRLVVERGR